ncbi:uncharacterized protein LOC135119450 [Zophobas morio]|uniref:uncharacterized protein LOC135119450 n=1 Tax=Zophobas morio TaxID=2755281 RepID=UPI003083BE83
MTIAPWLVRKEAFCRDLQLGPLVLVSQLGANPLYDRLTRHTNLLLENKDTFTMESCYLLDSIEHQELDSLLKEITKQCFLINALVKHVGNTYHSVLETTAMICGPTFSRAFIKSLSQPRGSWGIPISEKIKDKLRKPSLLVRFLRGMFALTIKYSKGEKVVVKVFENTRVLELKQKIEELNKVPVREQRLIYSGRLLKDDAHIKDYELKEGSVVHLVRNTEPATFAAPQRNLEPTPGTNPLLTRSGLAEISRNIPNMHQIVSQTFSDPHLREMYFREYPEIAHMISNNPQLLSILQNPDQIRQVFDFLTQRQQASPPITAELLRRSINNAMRHLHVDDRTTRPISSEEFYQCLSRELLSWLTKVNENRIRRQGALPRVYVTAEQLKTACATAMRTLHLE